MSAGSCMNHKNKKRKTEYICPFINWQTNSTSSNGDAELNVIHKPVASHCAAIRLLFADSLEPACSHQWGGDPLEGACDCIML